MPLFTSEYVFSDDYPTIEPSLKLDFANVRALDPRITFTRASTATYVGANGLIKTAGVDEARFDHDPATGESLGLLIEESRTNLVPHSQELNAGTWNKYFGSSVSANYATAPDGTQTADRIIFDGTPSGQITHNLSGLTIGQQYVFSAWVKSDGTSNNSCLLYVNGTNIQIIPTNEWQRIYVVRTSASTNENPLFLCGSVNSLLVWGVQYEQGSFPTSYIPTSGASATRGQEKALITGESFNSFFNPTEGFVMGTYKLNGVNTGSDWQTLVTMDDNTANNRLWLYARGGGDITQWIGSSGGTTQFTPGLGATATAGVERTIGGAYALNDVIGVYEGTLTTNDTTVVLPVGIDRMGIGFRDDNDSGFINGTIKKLIYYPKRLTNAQLQTLTQ